MTDFNRSPTLSLRHPGSSAGSATSASALTAARGTPARTAPANKPSAPARRNAEAAGTARAANPERTLDSTALLQGRSHVSIMHNGETYQLRATRLGKLILTK
ncbi:hemin uptake protein HemP [Paraburkholderia sp. B3]|uniref:hemin uptake protein HemP n=1 Tax=Paraburkholderia sp. B3 TaxID=3134791 RepID=UPI003982CB03